MTYPLSDPAVGPGRSWRRSVALIALGTMTATGLVAAMPTSPGLNLEAERALALDPLLATARTLEAAAMRTPAPITRSTGPRVTWTDPTCGSCHVVDPLFSHPVNVRPSMAVPAHLPLEDGLVTCATCHDNRNAADHGRARHLHDDLLRSGPSGPAFCEQCHDRRSLARADLHALALGRAHLPSGIASGASATVWQPRVGTADDGSSRCLECHDGSIAPGGGTQETGGIASGMRADGATGEHPVGVLYHGRADADVAAPLRAASTLDSRLRLFDGQVGCGSCHSPFSRLPSLLVMRNSGSALCLGCHAY